MREDKIVKLGEVRFKRGDLVSFLGGAEHSADGKGSRHVVRVADHTPDGKRAFLLTRSALPTDTGVFVYHDFQIENGAIKKLPAASKVWLTRNESDA